ncbi:PorP/SprF family type IX secretion system membrane protein [Sphingobacterium bovistauri]|uniref:Type IX secretion system membrane protein PorP/SprF n=1 Tax=Sphingobacterium bovistauri TaxID=2781959 RepID=A0ABS7Z8V5_9SPHI|nr:type IX secretion system membrane protein PorP/SprF [Sphingobacterium bovistauri]MCA5006590.1 type IX secretion system membrane protein PorP/SprF [Sphingobacterium bovistauri]
MRYCCILILIKFLLVIPFSTYAQQYIPFAQHAFNGAHINPAYVGYKEMWYAQMGIRSQWSKFRGAPTSGYASIDGIIDPIWKRHAAGLQIAYDKIGVQSATSLFGSYALRLQIDEDDTQRLSLGIAGGVTQYSLDGNDLVYIDENDPYIPRGMITTWRPDIRLGAFYYHPNWYLGLSVHDLFSKSDSREDFVYNQNSLEGLYRNTHAYIMLGGAIPMSEGFIFRPSLLVKDDLIGPTAVDVNAMGIFDEKFWVGLAFRSRSKIFDREYDDLPLSKFTAYKSIGLLAQLYTSSKLRIGYSFEHSLNKIAGMNNGTHEISIGVSLGKSMNRFPSAKYF